MVFFCMKCYPFPISPLSSYLNLTRRVARNWFAGFWLLNNMALDRVWNVILRQVRKQLLTWNAPGESTFQPVTSLTSFWLSSSYCSEPDDIIKSTNCSRNLQPSKQNNIAFKVVIPNSGQNTTLTWTLVKREKKNFNFRASLHLMVNRNKWIKG